MKNPLVFRIPFEKETRGLFDSGGRGNGEMVRREKMGQCQKLRFVADKEKCLGIRFGEEGTEAFLSERGGEEVRGELDPALDLADGMLFPEAAKKQLCRLDGTCQGT